MNRNPKIGITMCFELETDRFYLGRDYSEALQHFGAFPTHISLIPKREYIKNVLNGLDGVLLPGSNTDIEPSRFGEEPHIGFGRNIPIKDETDLLVIEEAEKLGLPILGICFGMQILNVSRGGSLFQDIEKQIPNAFKHDQGKPLEINSHTIEIEKGSLIADISNEDTRKVNSHHHQSVKELGKKLRATARAKDGVVECIEDVQDDKFVMGVQWHPELSWKVDEFSKNIFKVFVEECSAATKVLH